MRAITDHLTAISMEAPDVSVFEGVGIQDVIGGTADDDFVVGSDGDDSISGLGGNDLIGGEGGDDTLVGGAGDDDLQGGLGNDKLSGGQGDDLLNGGPGHDVLNGGVGSDTGVLAAAGSTPVSLDLSGFVAGHTATFTYDAAGDSATLIGIEKISAYGTAGDDRIIGADGDNHLVTRGGSDFIDGRGGADVIDDYDGDSTLIGGAGDDVINLNDTTYNGDWGGITSHDTVDGGAGHDTLNLEWDFTTSAVTMTKQHGHILISSADGLFSADVTGVEDYVISVGGASTLIGGAGDDFLQAISQGTDGDQLSGGAGDDTLRGGGGNDTLAGGGGDDTYVLEQGVYNTGASGLVYDASTFNIGGGKSVFADNQGGHDTVSGFEKVEILAYSTGDDTVIGSAGDDTIQDWYGTDSMSGGAGDDLILQASGLVSNDEGQTDKNDTLDGGAGTDTLSFADAAFNASNPHGWIFDLRAGTVTGVFTGTDTIRNFEHIIGSGASDTILGSQLAETLEGGGGDDTLSGGGGRDVLNGGAGDDTLSGGAGRDLLTGGDGSDTFAFTATSDSDARKFDKIADLTTSDVIDLSAIDANIHAAGDQAFVLVSAFDHHAGELMLSVKGKVTTLAADVDGDGVADFTVQIKGDHHDFSHFVL